MGLKVPARQRMNMTACHVSTPKRRLFSAWHILCFHIPRGQAAPPSATAEPTSWRKAQRATAAVSSKGPTRHGHLTRTRRSISVTMCMSHSLRHSARPTGESACCFVKHLYASAPRRCPCRQLRKVAARTSTHSGRPHERRSPSTALRFEHNGKA
jgi:hypothetical protein